MNDASPRVQDPRVSTGRMPAGHGGWWEHWSYAPGPVTPLPAHAHGEHYQIGLMGSHPGEQRLRGAWQFCPPGSLGIIHPGETHAPSARPFLPRPASYWMLYLPAGHVQTLLGDRRHEPFFASVVVSAPGRTAFLALHRVLAIHASALAVEERLHAALATLLPFRADGVPTPGSMRIGCERAVVRRAKELLREMPQRDFSLPELAVLCGISASYLSRAFAREVGVTLAAYQLQSRLEHARALLLVGVPLAQAAADAGFADQSHLSRVFRRYHGISPGRYAAKGKNVQDKPFASPDG